MVFIKLWSDRRERPTANEKRQTKNISNRKDLQVLCHEISRWVLETDGGFLSCALAQPFSLSSEPGALFLNALLLPALLGWEWDLHLLFGLHGGGRVGTLALLVSVAGHGGGGSGGSAEQMNYGR